MNEDFENRAQRHFAILQAAATLLTSNWCTTTENAIIMATQMLVEIEKEEEI